MKNENANSNSVIQNSRLKVFCYNNVTLVTSIEIYLPLGYQNFAVNKTRRHID